MDGAETQARERRIAIFMRLSGFSHALQEKTAEIIHCEPEGFVTEECG